MPEQNEQEKEFESNRRKLIDLNIAAARTLQSAQTGFIHLCYESTVERHDTIPLLENFCFSLALLRSRLSEHILEAKALIEKLLPFEIDGNFPIYLHEIPQCKKRTLGLDLLPIFHWIAQDFRSVLGEELMTKIDLLIARMVSFAYKIHVQRPLSDLALWKLKSYFEPHDCPDYHPQSAEEWGEMMIFYQLGRADDQFLKQALALWHPELCTSLLVQQQEKAEPKITLFDLFMGQYHNRYSKRALQPHRMHLLSSLIHPFSDRELQFSSQMPLKNSSSYAFYWGTSEQLHSLVFDPKKAQTAIEKTGQWTLTLPASVPPEGEESLECAFYLNLHPDHHILINGVKGTTFQLNDRIEIRSQQKTFTLQFELTSGRGRFFGQLSRANRSSQKAARGYEVYDWQIALRTICRTQECQISTKLVL